jgi:LmbE family N-acetylglucosaminyl deacetylase
VTVLLDDVPERAMAVYAHPADAEIACGATLARWAAAGCAISLVVCARGDKGSHEPDADADHVAAARMTEVADAAAALGIARHEVLDHLDGEVANTAELRAALVSRIRTWRPEIVLGHDPTAVFIGSGYVNHRDHREVGFALVDAVAPAAASPLYSPAAGDPHRVHALLLSGTLEPDAWVEVAGHLDAKAAALRCHRTQVAGSEEHLAALVHARASESQTQTGVDLTEGFRRITLG